MRRAFPLLFCFCIPLLAACGAGGDATTGRAAGYNVLLVSLDTTRADRLSPYGYESGATPTLAALAESGVVFEQCIAPAPLTLPSHATLLTGLEPYAHGVRDNGTYRLDGGVLTLAEVLEQAGYRTGAEVGAFVLNREFGLDQGFADYRDTRRARTTVDDAARRRNVERPAAEVTDSAIAWLREGRADPRPFFLFVHYFDAHTPYAAPEVHAASVADPYDAEIAYVDAELGRLLGQLEAAGQAERTLILVTADHGESLGQHGEQTHGIFVYDATLAVPWILRAPGVLPGDGRVEAQVRLADVAPTVIDLLGLEPLAGAQGESVGPLLQGRDESRGAYAEAFLAHFGFGCAPLRAWRESGFKYVLAPEPELYDLAADPGETRNLIAEQPRRAEGMREALAQAISGSVAGAKAGLDAEDRARLEGLGYVGAGRGADLPGLDVAGPDPKRHIESIERTATALGLVREGRDREALAMLEALLAEAGPERREGLAMAHAAYGRLLSDAGRLAEAREHLELALAVTPDHGEWRTNLGAVLAKGGDLDGAVAQYRRALEAPVVPAEAHFNLGTALRAMGEGDAAAAQFEQALELDPRVAEAWLQWAAVLKAQGATGAAEEVYRRGLEQLPGEGALRRRLGGLLLGLGRPAEALAEYGPLVAAEDPEALAGSGEALRQLGRESEALASLRRAVSLDPDAALAWLTLCNLHAQRGEREPAIEAARQARDAGRRTGFEEVVRRAEARLAQLGSR